MGACQRPACNASFSRRIISVCAFVFVFMASPPSQARAAGNPHEEKAALQHRLKEARTRIRVLSQLLAERIHKPLDARLDQDSQQIKVIEAEIAWTVAKHETETRERRLKEDKEFDQPARAARLADQVMNAQRELEVAKTILAKTRAAYDRIKQNSKETVDDRSTVRQMKITQAAYDHTKQNSKETVADRVTLWLMKIKTDLATLEVQKAEFQVEESKANELVEKDFNAMKQQIELRSEVEKSISNEMALRQAFELEKGKLAALSRPAANQIPAKLAPILNQLGKLFPLDRDLQSKLTGLDAKATDQSDAFRAVTEAVASFESEITNAERSYEKLLFDELASELNFLNSRTNE